MARFLNVFLGLAKVGVLEQDDHGALWFAYDAEWLSLNNATPLSASLPLGPEKFKSRECRPFFAGLLPEEEKRELVARRFGVSERNDFAILEKIGAECAGAVSLLPPGQDPPTGTASYRRIDPDELEEKLQQLPRTPLLAGEDGIRLSLAGAQGKAAVMIREGNYHLPLDGSPSTHILKPESTRLPGLVDNEFFCMRLAAAVGLDVAPVTLGHAGDIHFLQVERFDRLKSDDGIWKRVHQEDFCQALGIPPELKYQTEGGPGLKSCFALVREISSAPIRDVLRLFDAIVFNYVIGNNDAHGKNFSFLYADGEARLAPLYDLVSTAVYPELSGDMAMKVGGEKEAKRLRARHWISFFEEAELGPAMAIQRMRKLSATLQTEARTLGKEIHDSGAITELAGERCASILSHRWDA
jgi:serine/threonine-protein kinase HipA